jgi:hypothetical protein
MSAYFKNFLGAVLFALVSVTFFACSADDDFAPASVNTRAVNATVTVSGVINSDTTWTTGDIIRLDGKVYVSNNATLTIQPGVVIKGVASLEPEDASALVITRGSQILAIGTASNPIVFTAENGLKGGWGGLVILGNARINQATAQTIEGIDSTSVPAGVDITYGRTDDTLNGESSGTLSYVRVEFAGASISADNELNSFTFGGVGSGTQLDHLQAWYGADDAFEFFGGTVNAKYLLSTAADDDAFDFDLGYTGKLQFLVSVIDSTASYSANPNGIESDNEGSTLETPSLPLTHAVISNITIAGTSNGLVAGGGASGALLNAAQIRRNSGITIVNGIFYGYPNGLNGLSSSADAITLNTNVGTALPSDSAYVNFASVPASNVTVANAASLILTSPFGTFEGGTSYKSGGLTPSGGDALGDSYDASLLDAFFDTPDLLGGANDAIGNQWLNAIWVR